MKMKAKSNYTLEFGIPLIRSVNSPVYITMCQYLYIHILYTQGKSHFWLAIYLRIPNESSARNWEVFLRNLLPQISEKWQQQKKKKSIQTQHFTNKSKNPWQIVSFWLSFPWQSTINTPAVFCLFIVISYL